MREEAEKNKAAQTLADKANNAATAADSSEDEDGPSPAKAKRSKKTPSTGTPSGKASSSSNPTLPNHSLLVGYTPSSTNSTTMINATSNSTKDKDIYRASAGNSLIQSLLVESNQSDRRERVDRGEKTPGKSFLGGNGGSSSQAKDKACVSEKDAGKTTSSI